MSRFACLDMPCPALSCPALSCAQVGPEVARQVFEEHVEKLKSKEKDKKHKDDLDEEGGKKKKRSSRWVAQ